MCTDRSTCDDDGPGPVDIGEMASAEREKAHSPNNPAPAKSAAIRRMTAPLGRRTRVDRERPALTKESIQRGHSRNEDE